jgi:MFS family permease
MLLYFALFAAFGCTSPFLPAFLIGRGLGPEELGLTLGMATTLRLICGPIAGRLADRLQSFRAELAVCAILAASAGLWWPSLWFKPRHSPHSFRSPTLFPLPMLDHNQIRQDLNMDGCGGWARLRSSPARLWQGTR